MRGCTSDQSNIDDHRKNLKQPESHLKAYIQPKKRNISIHIPPRGTTRKAPRMTHGLMKNEAMTAKNTICVCTTESDDLIEEIVLREGKRPEHIILAPETQKNRSNNVPACLLSASAVSAVFFCALFGGVLFRSSCWRLEPVTLHALGDSLHNVRR